MSVFDEFEKIKNEGLPQILVIFGEADDMVQELKSQILDFVNFEPTDLSQAYYDLTTTNANLALEELESLPFFSDSRLVILENLVNLTTVKKSVLDEKQLKRFENFLENPSSTTQLVLILHGKLDSRLKVVKKLKSQAYLLEATELKTSELIQYFGQVTQLKKNVLAKIAEKSNDSFSIMKQNIGLVQTYALGREVTTDDVEKVVPKSLQDNIFALTDLIFKGKIDEARELVHDLTLQGEDLIKILAILTNSYRLYLQVKLMQEKRWQEQQQVSFLKMHPYPVKLANQLVRKLSSDFLKKSLLELIQLDFAVKTSVADKAYLFDITLIKLTLKKV
ncbi:DNA polymerase III subunit delta [Lactococcus protaetiae]|uniref:DNA polymerase III subunit delta n=1 Tax=Lactococcus protaetiae TaxID=2592653 RepID=A0A514ZAP2_9LACT|nr:DNA polymerase III subunit delta [Lactococcus protaetiae]MCL2112967.1 DNA polymerase III subunit delta [Streptococcaceae bacterium]QDK71641.1 DNA polymerase III subunit delta [Lactococcus protaetiae]